jgi:hypothetical protein
MVCEHVIDPVPVPPRTRGCEECLRLGMNWVHTDESSTCQGRVPSLRSDLSFVPRMVQNGGTELLVDKDAGALLGPSGCHGCFDCVKNDAFYGGQSR